ncbi:MAG: NAD(P)-dependent oxidoreductase [Erythrobacter sp.]
MQITIFGANGRVGKRAVNQAVERGHDVIAVMEEAQPHESDRVIVRQADVLKDDLADLLKGSDAVISCLGVPNDPLTLADPPPLYTEGAQRIGNAMRAAGLDRLVVISASFVETFDRGPLHFQAMLPALILVFKQMELMEVQLARRDDLRWTAVRPGWIMEGDPSPDPVITANVIGEGLIRSRTGDIANLMLDCVANDSWVRQTPAIASHEDDEATSLEAVVEEII